MGGRKSKQHKPDLNEVLIRMKIQSKQFARQSAKAAKEKKAYYEKAKKALKSGNEEGARLFLESASQKGSEQMKYQRISNRMEALSGKVKANFNSQDVRNGSF